MARKIVILSHENEIEIGCIKMLKRHGVEILTIENKNEHEIESFLKKQKGTAYAILFKEEGRMGSYSIKEDQLIEKEYALQKQREESAISKQEKLLAQFVVENLTYKKRIDLNFNPQNQNKTIDFSNHPKQFIESNKYLSNEKIKIYHFDHLIKRAIENGVFFRSAKNRREKNYWLSGLNAGIPLVPKPDEIHEITFMMHDFMHFVIPDLIYDGNESELHKNTYIIYRMMGEAFTLCLADMLFVDTLVRSGVKYDFSARKVYPLFRSLQLDFKKEKKESIRKLLYANTKFALCGDFTYYKQLLKNGCENELEEFVNYYTSFFVEDYKWTERNFFNMKKRKRGIEKWVFQMRDLLVKEQKKGLFTVSDFIEKIQVKKEENADVLIDKVFEYMSELIWNAMSEESSKTPNDFIGQSFFRYALGQMAIFPEFDHVKETEIFRKRLMTILEKGNTKGFAGKEIEKFRKEYEEYISLLFKYGHINKDDKEVYHEVYPLFEPHFVSYNKKREEYENISEMKERIFHNKGEIK